MRYRAPYATEWTDLDLHDRHGDGGRPGARRPARAAGRSTDAERAGSCGARSGLASLGGATLDNEENYLIKKLFTALGAIQIENQARI